MAMMRAMSASTPRAMRLPFGLKSPLSAYVPGLLLALLLAAASMALATLPQMSALGLSALTLAIVGGMIIGNTAYPHFAATCAPGVGFSKAKLLRLGIILFGFRITFQDIAAVGWSGLAIAVIMLISTFCVAVFIGRRWLHMDGASVLLIGAGSSICGAAAVLATEPVARASSDKVAVAVATVVVFGTLGMFGYPFIYAGLHALGLDLSAAAYGTYVGSTVHEVAQVVVAGSSVSEMAADHAVITKMIRVMMLAPFLLVLSALLARRRSGSGAQQGRSAIVIPWFAVLFLLVAAFNSFSLLPKPWVHVLIWVDNLTLAMAMGALGLTTHISAVRRAGARPLALASLLFVWLVVGGGLINALLGGWFSAAA